MYILCIIKIKINIRETDILKIFISIKPYYIIIIENNIKNKK